MPSIGDSYSLNSNDLSVELSTTDTMWAKKKIGMVERRAIIIVAQRSKYYEEKEKIL